MAFDLQRVRFPIEFSGFSWLGGDDAEVSFFVRGSFDALGREQVVVFCFETLTSLRAGRYHLPVHAITQAPSGTPDDPDDVRVVFQAAGGQAALEVVGVPSALRWTVALRGADL